MYSTAVDMVSVGLFVMAVDVASVGRFFLHGRVIFFEGRWTWLV
jgi:hypothetical protein